MIPAVDNSHVPEAQGLLTSRYAKQPNIKGLVTAFTARIQEIENAFWAMINAVQLANHPMAGGPWDVLDKIGIIVGVKRNGLSDADFLALIKIQAKANRSRGTSEDVLAMGEVMAAPGLPFYLETPFGPAAFYLGCWNVALNFPIFLGVLSQVRAAGVYGMFAYSTWADGNDFEYSSTSDPAAGQGGYGSVSDPNAGGLQVACVAL